MANDVLQLFIGQGQVVFTIALAMTVTWHMMTEVEDGE
jgi:hypothetical protein